MGGSYFVAVMYLLAEGKVLVVILWYCNGRSTPKEFTTIAVKGCFLLHFASLSASSFS